MRVRWISAVVVGGGLLLAHAGHAQPVSGPARPAGPPGPPPPPPPFTTLHLEATASVQVPPDVLVADLVAQNTSHSAAAAQRQVNTLMAAGMKQARAVAGVDARATGYSVDPADDKRNGWTAQQTLELRGHDGPSLLDLAGNLQQRGFATASLDWQLSDAARRKAHDAATIDALKQMQARAADAASALGLHVDRISDVRLDGTALFQPPRPGPMMMMAARMAPPPQATAAPEDVSADVTAVVLLRP